MSNELNNSEILFLYDCKECNPNGDPDNENKPRMDLAKERLLVSDVRLKRYIRDYFLHHFPDDDTKNIFVSKVNDKTVDATDRYAYFIASLLKDKLEYKEIPEEIKKELEKENPSIEDLVEKIKKKKAWDIVSLEDFLKHFIDVRFFGATLPIKDENRGSSIVFTGPVQFNWGYSLNRAELIESPSITSYFAGRTKGEGEEGGAIGKDWRVYYGLIAFYGRINGNSAEKTHLSKDDITSLDNAIWKSILTETNTRTKLNQYPRLYLRVEFKDKETVIGDLRRYVSIDKKEGLRDVGEYELDIERLMGKLEKYKDEIASVVFKVDDDLKIKEWDSMRALLEKFSEKKKDGQQ